MKLKLNSLPIRIVVKFRSKKRTSQTTIPTVEYKGAASCCHLCNMMLLKGMMYLTKCIASWEKKHEFKVFQMDNDPKDEGQQSQCLGVGITKPWSQSFRKSEQIWWDLSKGNDLQPWLTNSSSVKRNMPKRQKVTVECGRKSKTSDPSHSSKAKLPNSKEIHKHLDLKLKKNF